MHDMETGDGRQATYEEFAEVLGELVAVRDAHGNGCASAPLCIGHPSMEEITVQDRGTLLLTIMVAVSELSRGRVREAALRQRLEVQRGISTDALAYCDKMEAKAEDEVQRLMAKLDASEAELGRALAELTTWEESAGSLGPVGLPVDEA